MSDDTMPLSSALLKRGGDDVMKHLAMEVLALLMAFDGERRTPRNADRARLRHAAGHAGAENHAAVHAIDRERGRVPRGMAA